MQYFNTYVPYDVQKNLAFCKYQNLLLVIFFIKFLEVPKSFDVIGMQHCILS